MEDSMTQSEVTLISPAIQKIIDQSESMQRLLKPKALSAIESMMTQHNRLAALIEPKILPNQSLINATAGFAAQLEAIGSALNCMPTFDFAANISESIQACIPKYDFTSNAVRAIQETLPRLSAIPDGAYSAIQEFARQTSVLSSFLTESFYSQISQLVQSIPIIDFPDLHRYSEAFASIRDFEEKNELLKSFGWFLASEIPGDIVDYIREHVDEIAQEEVDTMIVQHFRKNRCAELKKVIASWKSLPYYVSRKDVFHDAQVCHSRRNFIASTTLLSLHFEGVVTDFARRWMQQPTYRGEKALRLVTDLALDMPMNTMSFRSWIVYQLVLECICATFSENFSPADPDSCTNNSRHKIAHGHAVARETEANSLRRFLYMNEMYKLFQCMESELSAA